MSSSTKANLSARFTPGSDVSIDGRPLTIARVHRDSANQIAVVGVARDGGVVIATYGAQLIAGLEPHSSAWLTPANSIWLFDTFE